MRLWDRAKYLVCVAIAAVLAGLLLSAICGLNAGQTIVSMCFIAVALLAGMVWAVVAMEDEVRYQVCEKAVRILCSCKERPISVAACAHNRVLERAAATLRREMGGVA